MLKPLNDRVVLEVAPQETMTTSGFVLAASATNKPQNGKVVAVGTGYILDNGSKTPLSVTVGDQVVFDEKAGVVVNYQGTDYLVIREKDIIAVVE